MHKFQVLNVTKLRVNCNVLQFKQGSILEKCLLLTSLENELVLTKRQAPTFHYVRLFLLLSPSLVPLVPIFEQPKQQHTHAMLFRTPNKLKLLLYE